VKNDSIFVNNKYHVLRFCPFQSLAYAFQKQMYKIRNILVYHEDKFELTNKTKLIKKLFYNIFESILIILKII
jgi:hypothetical protein